MATVMEFAVKMTCNSCVGKIDESLKSLEGVNSYEISLEKGTVLVESHLPSSVVQKQIESTGRVAVLKGYGSKTTGDGDGLNSRIFESGKAAVAMLGGTIGYGLGVTGVVRFVQSDEVCVIDGTIDGLTPGKHGLHIHECGDLSQGCDTVGDHFDLNGSNHGGPEDLQRHTGDLGNIEANEEGRAIFRIEDKFIKIWDIIGRSVVVTEQEDDYGKGNNEKSLLNGNTGERLACGIISRSAGLFENDKKICACDGVTIWDERNRPLAGPGRKISQGEPVKEKELCSAS